MKRPDLTGLKGDYARYVLALEEEIERLREALADLYAEVEMAEAEGICLTDRVPSLRARDLLADQPPDAAQAEEE